MRSASGSIRELDKGKRYRVTVEFPRDAVTGKRNRATKTVRGSRKDAERVKMEMLSEADRLESSCTLDAYFYGLYTPKARKRIERGEFKQRTLENYEQRYRVHVSPYIGSSIVSSITAPMLRRVFERIPGNTTRLGVYRVMSAIMQSAVYDGVAQVNVVKQIRPPKKDDYEPDVLNEDEIWAYLEHFHGSKAEKIFLLAFGGGFRRGEMVALDVEDIDMGTGVVQVDDSYVVSREKGVLRETPKNHKKREVVLPRIILDALAPLLPSSGPVLLGSDGKRITPDALTHCFEGVRDTLPDGVRRITLKNLRHTSLSFAYDSGADLKDVSRRGGHSTQQITEIFYLRPQGTRDAEVAEKMDSALRLKNGGKLPDGTSWHEPMVKKRPAPQGADGVIYYYDQEFF